MFLVLAAIYVTSGVVSKFFLQGKTGEVCEPDEALQLVTVRSDRFMGTG